MALLDKIIEQFYHFIPFNEGFIYVVISVHLTSKQKIYIFCMSNQPKESLEEVDLMA